MDVKETNEYFQSWGGDYENTELLTDDGNNWRVKSSDGTKTYNVSFVSRGDSDEVSLWECDCKAGQNGKTCKHIK